MAGVATLVLNRPKRGNSLTGSMTSRLCVLLEQLEKDPLVLVVVLRAVAGSKYFCTGMDLAAAGENREGLKDNVFDALNNFSKPLIGRINGPALGGGIGLLFSCDVRVMVESTYLSFAEVKRGLVPALISALIAPQLGLFKSKQYMMTGERISSHQLQSDGQVSQIVADETELDEAVRKYVQLFLEAAPEAVKDVKQLTKYLHYHSEEQNAVYVKELFQKMMNSAEARHGLLAFSQKQRPDWLAYTQSKL
jgi:methylglutaconyl-CoA hydratase